MTQIAVPTQPLDAPKGRDMTKRWHEMYDITGAAEYLGKSVPWIRREIYEEESMEPIRIGRLVLFTERMLENWKEGKRPIKPTRIELENIFSYEDAFKYVNENGLKISEGKFKQEIREGIVNRKQFGAKYYVYRKIDLDEFIEFRLANPRPQRGRPKN